MLDKSLIGVKRQDGRERKVEALEEQLRRVTQSAESAIPEQKKKLTLSEKRKKLAEKKRKNKNKRGSKDAGPSDAEINNLSLLYQSRKFDEAEKLALSFTERDFKHQLGWKVLGALYGQSGRNLKL